MALIYLVRHGKAESGWGEKKDPGLSEIGRQQAAAMAGILSPLGPMPIITSPLARTRQTAEPLGRIWNVSLKIEMRVAEIPSPPENVTDRIGWLKRIMTDDWRNLDKNLQSWRSGVIDVLHSFKQDTVVVSHFIAINAAVGEAVDNRSVVVFRPDNTSITVMETNGNRLKLVKLGKEDDTLVL